MISADQALAVIRAHGFLPTQEEVPLLQAQGRIVARNYTSPYDFPLFDNSAMDGFAVGGPEGPWQIAGEVAAGSSHTTVLAPCQAVRIFTGAPIPDRTYGVIPLEEASDRQGVLLGEVQRSAHIRCRAEEASEGREITLVGDVLDAPRIAALASIGLNFVRVERLPPIAVVSTGNEVVAPGTKLGIGQIYNSNAAAVQATVAFWGGTSEATHVSDCPASLGDAIASACANSDITVTTGGVSVGAHDHVVDAAQAAGFDVKFHGVAVKPGKPIAFGVRADGKVWFGLPGNPMSTWVGLLVFVAACVNRELKRSQRLIAEPISRKPGRDEFVPARVRANDTVSVLSTVGSHSNFGLLAADGLVRFRADMIEARPGDQVEFLSFPWRSHS